jgi:hypothetical protein
MKNEISSINSAESYLRKRILMKLGLNNIKIALIFLNKGER